MKKTILATIPTLVLAMSAGQAYAYTVSFNYQVAGDGSGKTSPVGVDASNNALPGYFIETFDTGSSNSTTYNINKSGGGTYTLNVPAGGGFTSVPVGDITIYNGSFGIVQGSVGGAYAAPAGDTTFYAYAPGTDYPNSSNAEIGIDYTNFVQLGYRITYLGIYYGSIDEYNKLDFYSGNTLVGTLTGTTILADLGGSSGNQVSDKSNVYVNVAFGANDPNFTSFRFSTTGIAFEGDNIVVGYEPVPEPATMLLLGTGLAGLIAVRRKKTA